MFSDHRRRFLELLRAEGAAAVIPTATHKLRNHDCHYRFRPTSDFWYLTGFAEPEAVLVLLPDLSPGAQDGGGDRSLLYLRERDPARETWDGRRLGVEAAAETLGLDEARPVASLWRELPARLAGYERIVWGGGFEPEHDRRVQAVLRALRARARGGARPTLVDPRSSLHELRLRKGPDELEHMRRAARISGEAHRAAMAGAAPGRAEYEIESLIEAEFRRRGSTGPAYASIVAGGANACVLHYVENRDVLRAGELLLVDAGAEWEYYASDVTRSFPVDGRFRDAQRELYSIVLAAQLAAIEAVAPGADFDAPHRAAAEHIVAGLIELGWIGGPAAEALERGLQRRWTVHRTSHFLGLDVHDCGATSLGERPRALEPGMVLTVEPGLYVAPEDAAVPERWRGIGIRIEDDVLVTETGREVLTADVPKRLEELEAACAERELSGARR